MRVAILGSGGLGAFFGGLLARAGHDVAFIARGANLEALRQRGLTLKTLPSAEVRFPVRATNDPREIGPVDLVWCCVKAYDVDAAARQIPCLTGPKTVVLPIQNGVDAAEWIAPHVGADRVLGGLCLGGATLEEPGVVAQKTSRVRILIGELDGSQSQRTDRLREALAAAGIEVEAPRDIRVALWEKFLGVCGTHSLTALMRLPVAALFADPETSALVRGLTKEAEEVAKASGVPLPDDAVDEVLKDYQRRGAVYASIYYDLLAGRRLELEYTNGAVVRLARRHRVETPLNFAVYAALKPWINGPPLVAAPPT